MPPTNKRAVGLLSGLGLCLTALGVTGCEEYRARRDLIVVESGEAVAHNIAVQTIDPWPVESRDTRIDIDGERILIGTERYKANKSIPPKGLSTQSVSTGSAGSGSVSSGGASQ